MKKIEKKPKKMEIENPFFGVEDLTQKMSFNVNIFSI